MAAALRGVSRALLSVSDKTGLVELGQKLAGYGVELLSTGGTAAALRAAGLAVRDVAEVTGFPEMMDGRVKTLHPRIHGGLLGRRDNAGDAASMAAHGIPAIDLLVVSLYPFERTVRSGAGYDDCIEQIDVGGPAMIRGASKNHADVAVVTDPAQYAELLAELESHSGKTTLAFRQRLAAAAFAATAAYDAAISAWFAGQLGQTFPARTTVSGRLVQELRYGENPHQRAALYLSDPDRIGIASARQLQGKELSYNNIGDADAALELVSEFVERPAVAIIKHANPCGVAEADSLLDAYRRALACDPVSAFGGIIAVNRTLDAATAAAIGSLFAEVVIAPDADPEAQAVLGAKKNLRVLLTGRMPDPSAPAPLVRSVAGGFLVQDRDARRIVPADLKVVSKRPPSERELADLLMAFRVCKHVKSNAIIYVRDGATVGIGAGQMSRVDSARIAAIKSADAAKAAGLAEPPTRGSVVASDAFFPFADGLIAAAEAGATAVIQPGGSLRDEEVIAAADARDLAMVFTGVRHFRH